MDYTKLIAEDASFSESAFIAKVDNTFIMLLSAIITNNMNKVKHKISDELFEKYSNYVNDLSSKNQRQMYDELNVKSTEITEVSEDDDNFIIKVLLVSRYMDYIIDSNGKLVSGNNSSRIQKNNYLTFVKSKSSKAEGAAKKCPGCGANVDVNNNGICAYCGSVYNTEKYDWVLTELETV